MKKKLLTAVAIAVLSTASAYATESTFYLKDNVDWSKLTDLKGRAVHSEKIYKYKPQNNVHFGVGAGYHVMDNVRVDLVLDHFVDQTIKHSNVNTRDSNRVYYEKTKANINTLLLNGYFDIFTVDAMKIFIGASVGLSQIKAKITSYETNKGVHIPNEDDISVAKQKYGVAFAGYVGVSYEFTQGIIGELSYSNRDLGTSKPFINKKGNITKVKFLFQRLPCDCRYQIRYLI